MIGPLLWGVALIAALSVFFQEHQPSYTNRFAEAVQRVRVAPASETAFSDLLEKIARGPEGGASGTKLHLFLEEIPSLSWREDFDEEVIPLFIELWDATPNRR